MNNIGLSLTINKFTTFYESTPHFIMVDSQESARKEIINILNTHYKKFHIDFPSDLSEFEHEVFGHTYVHADAFVYKLFINNKWEEPWETQDLYDDVIERIIKEESDDPPDFSDIYGEPNPDESINDKCTMENDEYSQEMEKKLKEIMTQSSTVKMKDDQVKDCKCKSCQEGYAHQDFLKMNQQEQGLNTTSELEPISELNPTL